MSNDKNELSPEALEKMAKDEKFAKNQALKKEIQETHDKEYKEAEALRNEKALKKE